MNKINEIININNNKYQIIKLLGKGKGGYSYLASKNNQLFTIKMIHHEPCSYYSFDDKLASELRDYDTLKRVFNQLQDIFLPEIIEVDKKQEIIVKEYIAGTIVSDLAINNLVDSTIINKVYLSSIILKDNNLNIDYFPTNFIIDEENKMYYIDYECNLYMDKWNFINWGIYYWFLTQEYVVYLQEKEICFDKNKIINEQEMEQICVKLKQNH